MQVTCPHCHSQNSSSGERPLIVRSGFFRRKSDQARLQRFLCKTCQKSFSEACKSLCYRQKKRHLNPPLLQLFASGVSQRRLAFLFRTNRKTVIRKFLFIGLHAERVLELHRESCPVATEVEFDDLETSEHSKLKPLSVALMVEAKTRRILGFRVAQMPAKGLLAAKSRKKYGYREDERKLKRESLFAELKPFLSDNVLIKTDESPHYPSSIKSFFPQSTHATFKSKRGCVVGQGELKASGADPIFKVNHTFAMLRANMNRLFRKTWNTTKKAERLRCHIMIYALYHNLFLIDHPAR